MKIIKLKPNPLFKSLIYAWILNKVGIKIIFKTNYGHVELKFYNKEWTTQEIAECILFCKEKFNWDVKKIENILGWEVLKNEKTIF